MNENAARGRKMPFVDGHDFAKSVVTNYPRLTSNSPRQMTEADVIDTYRAAY